MDIPDALVEQVRAGKAVLFLGSGASAEARNSAGAAPPTSRQLAQLLSDRFLGGAFRDAPLNQVGEYAISESDLYTVQDYIRSVLEPFKPSAAHLNVPTFAWWGLATTNYDRLIELAYETAGTSVQRPRPFIANGDRVEDVLRVEQHVMLVKLHGCVTRISDVQCPLILTTDQYLTHRQGRNRIFDHLRGWAYERSIIFVGHSLEDPDLRAMLLELTTQVQERPRYFAVLPQADDVARRFWESKKVTLLEGTFSEFMSALDARLPSAFRGLAAVSASPAASIARRFRTAGDTLSPTGTQFLLSDVEYVSDIAATERVDPTDFYRGWSPAWSALDQDLDIRRALGDTIMADSILSDEPPVERRGPEIILIKAHAGAGKSIVLRRLAWDAAKEFDRLCLFVKPSGVLSTAPLQELLNITRDRVYLFVDDAADRVRELQAIATGIGPEGARLTIILAERINEWNVSASDLAPYLSVTHELPYLSHKEIDALLQKLETHRALGTLERLPPEQRHAEFAERAGRQLLVALHEATLGRPFEDIVANEFRNITPSDAQDMYLNICVLNRLDVPVRAGVIARLHDIGFDAFRERFFAPLEHIVHAEYDTATRDYVYRARHPHIAQIVFERALGNQEQRFDAYIRCLEALNIDYGSDRKAFRQMIRGRALPDLFPNHELCKRVYVSAQERAGEDSHVLHQMALYEMHRPNGNLTEASRLLLRASELAGWDVAIKHSLAELKLKRADLATSALERTTLLDEAEAIAGNLKTQRRGDSFGYHTAAKAGLRRLRALVAERGGATELQLERLVRDIEANLSEGFQRTPDDPHLRMAEADLAQLLRDEDRVVVALEKAFAGNPRNASAATRLAKAYAEREAPERAVQTLKTALDANPGDRTLHFAYARLLLDLAPQSGEEIAYHLVRAYTPGDHNHYAQLLHGRQLFMNGDREGARSLFQTLRSTRAGGDLKDGLLHPMDGVCAGTVTRMEATYCLVARDRVGDWIVFSRRHDVRGVWGGLAVGDRVAFRIAFNLRGPSAFEMERLT